MFSRRDVLAVYAAGAVVTSGAASFGNPNLPPQGAINAEAPGNLRDPGPHSEPIVKQFPSAQFPPTTDVGNIPMDWASFNNTPKRVQNDGWARQMTQADFAISDTITGVNKRLTAGGIRELHCHQAAEWAITTYGSCRATVLDVDGHEGGLWYFPAGQPHSLQGLGPDGCKFVICFDDGDASEFNMLLLTDWLAQTFARIPLQNLWIFQGKLPGDLAADQAAVDSIGLVPPDPFIFRLASSAPAEESKGGDVRIADSGNFSVSTRIAAALEAVRPGGDPRDALASERRRMAILYQGQRAHDGVQHRSECDDDGFQCRGHWLRQTKPRALRREYRRQRHGVRRRVLGFPLRRNFSVRLADAYAAGIGCTTPEHRRSDDRQMAGQCSGRDAALVATPQAPAL